MKIKELMAKINEKKWLKRLLVIALILILVITGIRFALNRAVSSFRNQGAAAEYTVEQAQIRTVENYLSSSGTAQPLNTYSVTTISSVEGTVLSADFEEGDLVEKGQVLYRISTDSLDNRIESAQKSIDRARKKYNQAVEDYEDAKEGLNDLEVKAETTGYIKELLVEEGDSIQAKTTAVAQVYNNKTMVLEVPFLSNEVSEELVGKTAIVEMSESGEEIKGTVTKVSGITETLSGNRLVKYVTIEVKNPGAIVEGDTAAAYIEDLESSEEGSFSLYSNGTISSDVSGEIETIYVKEGDWIEEGDVICKLSEDTVEDQLENYQDQIDSAKESLEDAEDSLEEIYDAQADYTITSPITGTIIQKNIKVGDTISAIGNSALCLIYDLSAMTFEMYVDELDVMNVEAGQTVNITADALPDETFEGVITNVSLVSNSSGGVTQYPVTVQINEVGSLLPGMNISGEIVIESAENVLTVPADAIQRGNVVYVQDETVTEAQGDVPAGFRSVEVEVGVSDGSYIEIISGLSEGDAVYVPAHAGSEMQMMPGNMQGGMQGGAPGGNMQGGGDRSSGGNRGSDGGGMPSGRPDGGF